MPVIQNAEIHYLRANPKFPNKKFDPENPSWDCQIRTTSKDTKKKWEELGLKVTAVIPEEEGGKPYYKTTLRRRMYKADRTLSAPVRVVNGRMQEMDPDSVGNGSIGNIRIFQYESKGPKGGMTSILAEIQVVRHIVRKVRPREDAFEETDTEVVDIPDEENETETETAATNDAPATAGSPKPLPEGF